MHESLCGHEIEQTCCSIECVSPTHGVAFYCCNHKCVTAETVLPTVSAFHLWNGNVEQVEWHFSIFGVILPIIGDSSKLHFLLSTSDSVTRVMGVTAQWRTTSCDRTRMYLGVTTEITSCVMNVGDM